MRTLPHPATEAVRLDAVLAALTDPLRRRIVRQLSEGVEAQACGAFDLPVTKSTSTHHFRVLREAGVITQHYRGNKILNQLRADDLETRFPGLLQAILAAEQVTAAPTHRD
ncbi:helix-turn-helix transcriptional regulator [Streptomyces sp. NBRC 110028]|uniref:ArsR/SmtB family transcription factor n=1 Tax=Streptomyces sp. NBRC 110028 TaxID=1621260 RepID=UPI0006E2E66D|nr:helix-turn-helix transcriptional regulator [Streptomyces sp. NBRC 110028]